MIMEALAVVGYEVVTTVVGVLGLKAISGDSLRKRLAGINQPKHIPIVDRFLKRELGHMSKREQWLSLKAVKAVNRVSKYESFRLILVLLSRKARSNESRSQVSSYHTSAGRTIARRLLAH